MKKFNYLVITDGIFRNKLLPVCFPEFMYFGARNQQSSRLFLSHDCIIGVSFFFRLQHISTSTKPPLDQMWPNYMPTAFCYAILRTQKLSLCFDWEGSCFEDMLWVLFLYNYKAKWQRLWKNHLLVSNSHSVWVLKFVNSNEVKRCTQPSWIYTMWNSKWIKSRNWLLFSPFFEFLRVSEVGAKQRNINVVRIIMLSNCIKNSDCLRVRGFLIISAIGLWTTNKMAKMTRNSSKEFGNNLSTKQHGNQKSSLLAHTT